MPAPNTAAEIGREVVDRMVAHCRHVATKYANAQWKSSDLDEVRAIVALLPEPVDPDLEQAQAIAFEFGWGRVTPDSSIASAFLSAIKRGRELALKARAVGEGESGEE